MDDSEKVMLEPSARTASSVDDDNKLLEIGYVPSFRREFSNIATVSSPSYLGH